MEDYPCQTKMNGFWKMVWKEKMINNQLILDI
jgi:protein tyrosine phosphatase